MTEQAERLTDLAIRPTYEEIVGSIKNPDVQELLRDAQSDENRVTRELEALEQNEDLTLEAKAARAQEVIGRYSPQISERYAEARSKVEKIAESSYLGSLPFPGGGTYEQARARDTQELLAIQNEANTIAQRMGSDSLQEMSRQRSKHPNDKGIQQRSDYKVEILRREFDAAMAAPKDSIEARVRALAIQRVCEGLGVDLAEVVGHHRKERHHRALADHNLQVRQFYTLPKDKKIGNPFEGQRERRRRVGTYTGSGPVLTGGSTQKLFENRRRKPSWK